MKTLLAVIGDSAARPVLDVAFLVAQRFGSRIVALNAVTTEYAVVFGGEMGFAISPELDRKLEQEGRERCDQARAMFDDFMLKHGIQVGATSRGDRLSAEWREEVGRQNAVAGTLGRVYDLIIVERPAQLASLAEATLEDALFESGRPVLMAPPTPPRSLGERILVAWNGSTETARAVALAMPLLKQAKSVHVVSAEGGVAPGPTVEDLGAALQRHGLSVTWRHVAARGRVPGRIFLDEAKEADADLLVKGAYTQSRLRQMIFGGATRYIIMEAHIPVLLAH